MKRPAYVLPILASMCWLLLAGPAAANYVIGGLRPTDAEMKRLDALAASFRPRADGAVTQWSSVVPAVDRPTDNAHASPPNSSRAQLQKILRDIAGRADFELELPNPAATRSKVVQVVWYERGTVVIGAEALYSREPTAPGHSGLDYWGAGQMQRSHEDPKWAANKTAIPIATRFWKYRFATPGPDDDSWWAQVNEWQLYRYHRGVESWVGGDLSKRELIAEAASFKEVDHGGISPLLVLSLGALLIFIWPAFATYRAARGYERKTGRRAQLGLPQRRGGAKGERTRQAAEREGTQRGPKETE